MFFSNSTKLLKISRSSQKFVSLFQRTFVVNKSVNFGCLVKNLSSKTETEYYEANSKSVMRELEILNDEDKPNGDLITDDCDYNYDECFKNISQGDPSVERELRKLEFEVALMRDQYEAFPKLIEERHWRHLLKLENVESRIKYYAFIRKNEIKRMIKKEELEFEQQLNVQKLLEVYDGNIMYGVGFNSLFFRVYDKSLNNLAFERMFRAMMFSQAVVFDCSYDSYMNEYNARYCAHELVSCIASSKQHPYPLHVKLCNLNFNSEAYAYLKKFSPTVERKSFPWDFHEESYLDLYPKEKIVYLTPYASQVLTKYNHEDVYVIGLFHDKGKAIPASLAKAKENKLRMAKLPLDNVDWRRGSKSLPVNIVLDILLDMRLYEDWDVALRKIPIWYLTPHGKGCSSGCA